MPHLVALQPRCLLLHYSNGGCALVSGAALLFHMDRHLKPRQRGDRRMLVSCVDMPIIAEYSTDRDAFSNSLSSMRVAKADQEAALECIWFRGKPGWRPASGRVWSEPNGSQLVVAGCRPSQGTALEHLVGSDMHTAVCSLAVVCLRLPQLHGHEQESDRQKIRSGSNRHPVRCPNLACTGSSGGISAS